MKRTLKVVLVVAICMISLGLVAACGVYWHARATIRDTVSALKQVVTRDFNDPGSAQFRSIELQSMSGSIRQRLSEFDIELLREHRLKYVRALLMYDRERFQLCGEVNAKNAFGAYVGYKHFWINSLGGIEDATPFIATREGDDFPERMCEIGRDELVVYKEE